MVMMGSQTSDVNPIPVIMVIIMPDKKLHSMV